jgi:putative oxidoreductase
MTRTLVAPRGDDHIRPLIAQALHSDNSLSQTSLRLTLALVLLPHGMQHLFGMFGGYGFAGTFSWMTNSLGIPAPFAAAGILLEFVGPALLVVGIASRLWGAALALFMAMAASTHLANGFFMNWFGTLPAGSEGFEYHLLAIAMAVSIAVKGGGAFSLDRVVGRRLLE